MFPWILSVRLFFQILGEGAGEDKWCGSLGPLHERSDPGLTFCATRPKWTSPVRTSEILSFVNPYPTRAGFPTQDPPFLSDLGGLDFQGVKGILRLNQ